MATKNFAKRVNFLVVFFMAAVINLFVSACSDPYDRDELVTTSEERIAKPQPTPEVMNLAWSFSRELSNHTTSVDMPWTLRENTSEARVNATAQAWVSHKDDRYAVAKAYREVSLAYTQEHTSASQVYSKLVRATSEKKEYQDSVRYTAQFEDGNLAYLDVVMPRVSELYISSLDTTVYNLPYIKVKNATVINIETLPGTTAMTRAAYVSDSIVRRITWRLDCEVVKGDVKDEISYYPTATEFTVDLQDMWKVLLLSEDDIERAYSKDRERVVISDTEERCSFTEVFVMKSGEEHSNVKNIVLNRELKGIPEYLKNVTSFSYTWRRDNGVQLGSVNKSIRKENNWTIDGRTDSFGADISNDAEPVTTSYTFYHEGATYKDEWLEEAFELITPTMAERSTRVESIVSDDANYDQARLFNDINTSYLGYAQTCGETVKLQKPAVRIDREGWDEMNCIETIYNDSVVWIPTYIIHYSDGNEIVTRFRCSDTRLLEVLTNWNSIEENESESTGNVTVGEATTRNMSRTVNGAEFKWVRETRDLNNKAQLAGSVQNNGWRSVEPNAVTVTYRGKSYTFNRNSIQTTNTASVTGGAVNGGYKVYNYRDVLDYYFGENVKQATAPGTIRVLAKQLVREGWDNASAKEVWSDNRVDWTLDWVEEFSDGEVNRTSFSWYDTRSYTVDTNWSSIEKNNNYNTSNYVVTLSNSANQSKNVNGAEFKWVRETHKINTNVQLAGSSQENRWTAVDPFNCTVTYKGKTYDFGRKSVALSHRDNLSNGVENGSYMVYTYGDAMSYTISGNTKTLTAPGEIKVLNESIISEGWDAASARQTVTAMMVNWTVDYVVKYNTGKEDRTTYSHSDMRSFNVDTNWSSIEKNNNQSTTSATVTVSNTATQSQNVNGATFKWTRETRSMKSTAKLNASNQQNGWTAVDPNGCSVTYNGKTFTFDRLTASVSNSARVSDGSESNGYKVYSYSDNLTYVYGGDTKSAAAPGEIKVKVSEPTFFPEEWGTIVAAVQTVANNESHKGFVYTWSLRFKNGYVLPVVVRSGATNPEYHFEYVEKTQITTYNGGTYESSTNKWINTTAQDEPDHMIWSRSGVERANKNYNEAKRQNWDEGHLISGKPSVNTSRYTLTISNGKLTAKDTYTGATMGTWSSYTGE